MTFIKPKRKEIYKKITTNKKIVEILEKNGVIITKEDYVEEYGKISDKAISYINEQNEKMYNSIADILFDNIEHLEDTSVNDLIKEKFLFKEFNELCETEFPKLFFKELYYTYKTSSVECFFQNNWEMFIPEVDLEHLKSSEVNVAFLDSVAKTFDKLDTIITNTKDFKSYYDIPFEYINHLSQLLGLEQDTLKLDSTYQEQYRILAKNILDVYSLRGAEGTFELLFNLFGFKVKFTNYFFDRRNYYNKDYNKETLEKDRKKYKFYLTAKEPAENKIEFGDEIVNFSNYSEMLNLENFDDLVDEYGVEAVLGINNYYYKNGVINDDNIEKYEGDVYKYFKTNYCTLAPNTINGKNFSLNQLYIISAIIDFLLPEFYKRDIIVKVIDVPSESITVNGPRDTKGDGDTYDGFRMLDSETWIIRDEIENPEGTEAEKEALREEQKKYLKYGENIIRVFKNDIFYDEEDNNTITVTSFDNKEYYMDKKVADEVKDEKSLRVYTNSVGETEGSRNVSGRKNLTSFTQKTDGNNKLIINTNYGWNSIVLKNRDAKQYVINKPEYKIINNVVTETKKFNINSFIQKYPINNINYPEYDKAPDSWKPGYYDVDLFKNSLKTNFLQSNKKIEISNIRTMKHGAETLPKCEWKIYKDNLKAEDAYNFIKTHKVFNYFCGKLAYIYMGKSSTDTYLIDSYTLNSTYKSPKEGLYFVCYDYNNFTIYKNTKVQGQETYDVMDQEEVGKYCNFTFEEFKFDKIFKITSYTRPVLDGNSHTKSLIFNEKFSNDDYGNKVIKISTEENISGLTVFGTEEVKASITENDTLCLQYEDEYYKGNSEKEDIDDYIFNNNYRFIDNCYDDTNSTYKKYMEGSIDRPMINNIELNDSILRNIFEEIVGS